MPRPGIGASSRLITSTTSAADWYRSDDSRCKSFIATASTAGGTRMPGARTLVVCPTSVIFNWAAELARFRPNLRVCVYHGAARALDPAADVTLTSYALLRLDATALSATPWRAVVLDEAQAIKNPDSQNAQAAFDLRARHRFVLTGTPIETDRKSTSLTFGDYISVYNITRSVEDGATELVDAAGRDGDDDLRSGAGGEPNGVPEVPAAVAGVHRLPEVTR